jgi:Spx/MgsR family transcriptional regulator
MYTVYGIPNCNSVQKARNFLAEHQIEYTFHDYKKEGISKEKLTQWSKQLGWENLINKKGTTWRALDAATQESITTQAAAIKLMMEHTSIIKRPIIMKGDEVVVMRFDEAEYGKVFL